MKILIVDDNERVRRLIKLLVSDICDEVIERADGESALTAYAEHVPDWVLMDIEMGKMDGLESSLGIRNAYPEARILIVTNYDDNGLRERAKEIGACGYVLKEDLSMLREILTEVSRSAGGCLNTTTA